MMESFRDEFLGLELSESSGLVLPRDRALVRMEEARFSDILITPVQPHSRIGTVVKVGKRPLTSKGVELEHVIQEGDRVAVLPHDGVSVLWQGCPALILRETEVLAVIEREEETKEARERREVAAPFEEIAREAGLPPVKNLDEALSRWEASRKP